MDISCLYHRSVCQENWTQNQFPWAHFSICKTSLVLSPIPNAMSDPTLNSIHIYTWSNLIVFLPKVGNLENVCPLSVTEYSLAIPSTLNCVNSTRRLVCFLVFLLFYTSHNFSPAVHNLVPSLFLPFSCSFRERNTTPYNFLCFLKNEWLDSKIQQIFPLSHS